MMKCIVIFFLSAFAIAFAVDPCRFEYPGKGVIDLTTAGHSDGTAAFVNQTPASSPYYTYTYNPCKPFSGPGICENVAACQVTVDTGIPYNLGTQGSAVWSPGSGSGEDPSITYSEGERKTIVRLLCSTSGETHFEVVGEGPVGVYLFRLTHKCACWNGCGSPSSSTTTGLPPTTPVVETCRFTDPDHGVIDLTSLGHTDGTPAYPDTIPSTPDGFKYSYNPCKPFSEGPICQNAAACLFSEEGTDAAIIGVQNTVQYYTPGTLTDYPVIAYQYGEDFMAYVELACSTTDENKFDLIAKDGSTLFLFRLTNKCACWNACSSTPASTTTFAPVTTTSQSVTDECRYVHPEKGIIDFSFIGRTDEKAAYSDEMTRTVSNFKYSYNPCRSFSQGSGCIGAAVCQVTKDGQETFTLGTQESHWWDIPSDANALPSLNYMYADKKVSVLLQCSTEGNNEFQAFGEDPVNTFKFQLTHQCACWNGC